ncbi:Transmembrane protein [Trema orientale]|uniref:Transmembrane protein n=1 Tax=Trema orientale TaxID=63057 RepID=A0A2P5F3S6_TREOI|nr:Transmembrane protein [Trema orientale]
MYRSASWNRVSDHDYGSMQSPPPSSMRTASSFEDSDQQLPLYDLQIADMAKKEKARLKFAENAVHLIPLVLIFCAFILWLFSTTPDGSKGESIVARIEGLSIEGEIDNDSDGTQTGIIPTVDLRYMDSPRLTTHKASKKMD